MSETARTQTPYSLAGGTLEKCMSACREIFEEFAGRKYSDRHWRRIKGDLLAIQDTDQKAIDVRDAAILRRNNPRALIDLETVRRYQEYAASFPELTCNGKQLLEGIHRVLRPKPSLPTIYRWGHEINCPFSFSRCYEPEEVRLWIKKIVGQSKFRLKIIPPNLRY